jgi:hypothetical protein
MAWAEAKDRPYVYVDGVAYWQGGMVFWAVLAWTVFLMAAVGSRLGKD